MHKSVVLAVIAACALLSNTAVIQPGNAAAATTLDWSGYTWDIKAASSKMGPGPNYYSASNSWVDTNGKLHLRISKSGSRWYCAEIGNAASLGYGTYTWVIESRIDNLNQNAVLGLFTWNNNDASYAHREIDFEASRWSNAADPTSGQFVVQPWDTPGNYIRIALGSATPTTISFTWRSTGISFAASGATPSTWNYSGGSTPPAGGENARINLWLNGGKAPYGGKAVEVVLRSFSYTP